MDQQLNVNITTESPWSNGIPKKQNGVKDKNSLLNFYEYRPNQ